MKTMTILKYASSLFLPAALLWSCGNFEEINTDRQGVTSKMAEGDGVAVGGFIQTLQRTVVPVGTAANKTDYINMYQTAYHLGQDTWAGYFGQNGDWNGGRNHTTYFLMNRWVEDTYKQSYTNAFSPWLSIKNNKSTESHPEYFALAQVLKIATWHKATDIFGPIPYTKAGTGLFVTPYDSQEVIYKSMLDELEKAVDVLTRHEQQGGVLFPDYDLVYAGNATKWVKFANSLMLRLALRMRYVAPEEAKRYAEKAVAHSIGVMKDAEDGASVSLAHGLQFENPIERLAGQYAECRMGTPAFSYMAGYEDPRLPRYYQTSTHPKAIELDWADGKYFPVPVGAGIRQDDKKESSIYYCSLPKIERTTPVYWMRASESFFLRAEGALFGWNMGGEAESLYRQGIEMSFAENGVPVAKVDDYIDSDNKPVDVDMSSLPGVYYVFKAASQATVKFEGSQEEKLEKIMIQKWIALYPNGQEAWTEWRRTGYPAMPQVLRNRSNGTVDSRKGIRRMHYTISTGRSEEERKALAEAVTLLGGPDTPATNLWWDKK